MGAGILPIAFYEGKLYFLFGEECSERKWFDFGGGKENGESNINTAIRECYEELDGFIGTMTELKQLVKERLLLKINFENYTTFLIQIDYNSKLPFYFNNHHKFLLDQMTKRNEVNFPMDCLHQKNSLDRINQYLEHWF